MNFIKDVKRGDIFLIRMSELFSDSKENTEKYTAGIVIQNDIGNKFSTTTIVAKCTTTLKRASFPTHIIISKDDNDIDRDLMALLENVTTIDKGRIVKKIGRVNDDVMKEIDKALGTSLNLKLFDKINSYVESMLNHVNTILNIDKAINIDCKMSDISKKNLEKTIGEQLKSIISECKSINIDYYEVIGMYLLNKYVFNDKNIKKKGEI